MEALNEASPTSPDRRAHHQRPTRAYRGFSLVEALIALVITAMIVGAAAALMHAYSIGARTLPITGARAASDARVQAMVQELRSAVAISQISSNQVTAIVNTAGNAPTPPAVNGVPTGTYAVSFYF